MSLQFCLPLGAPLYPVDIITSFLTIIAPNLRRKQVALSVFVVMVCLAVCFVKQHSALDVLAALPVCVFAELMVYGKDYWFPRLGGKSA